MSTVGELIKLASQLPTSDKAELASTLLEDLDPHPHYVSDAEALRRRDELASGKVRGLTEEEFKAACGRSQ